MYENIYNANQYPLYRRRISLQQAKQIALKRIPGEILQAKMDMENGMLVYEIFIRTPRNRIFEVEVIARTGRIKKIEEEKD
ncbi:MULTISPECIES: PepSY domain-containing protein [Bacillus]|uniref:PepSY domain-containing protein n=1 Tax=Bacillus TaxID=1386 RepID=UPI002E1C8728|nr:PepSY domain-containing protein [Bacillus smithii]MED1421573.1 PepSY domain-containing protein [Bacillus smithii]MED1457333.1 PepSY domain-containing protein [Bacillus smithii]MED1490897.1 PepSY domain-containing protein [Bacillus smithii]